MTKRDFEEFHRKTAKRCFNEAWDYLEKKNRDADDDRHMLHLAHTARYHWAFVRAPKKEQMRHRAVGDWQISRVYATLNQPSLALLFAKSALETMQKNNLSDVLHTGYEAVARAHTVAKEFKTARDYLRRARKQLAKSNVDDEDRKIYSDQIQETERLIR
jgi:hypothetical protein